MCVISKVLWINRQITLTDKIYDFTVYSTHQQYSSYVISEDSDSFLDEVQEDTVIALILICSNIICMF